jgi:lipopolysaccharide transport system ATP-binding protein
MSDIAVRVEHLSKQYRLGASQPVYPTFREAIMDTLKAPVRMVQGKTRPKSETFWALDDVSFEIKHGEAVGIIGRNGAGKSTLLKILSRITRPTHGKADLYGRVGSLLEVGTGFHPELTGRENIYLNGAILGMSRNEIQCKFDEIVDFAEVEKFLDTQVKHYSSGMYVRLAFAVAAQLEPEILVVDEVLAVGDAEFQKKCLGKMEDVTHRGRTVLFVSHNMGMISSLCQRAILLGSGKIIQDSDAASAIAKYYNSGMSSPYSSDFTKSGIKVGDDYATLLEAHIEDEHGTAIGEINIRSPFKVKMKYEFHNAVVNSSYPNFHFYNSQGLCVFVTNGDRRAHLSSDGIYEATCIVPGSLLNNDTYFIDLALTFTHNGIHVSFWQPGALAVVIRDNLDETIDVERQGYSGVIPGVIRPNLSWEIKQIS